MNTDIGDAVNLAWKLASVLRGRADQSLLDSYEPERIGLQRWQSLRSSWAFMGSYDAVVAGFAGRKV